MATALTVAAVHRRHLIDALEWAIESRNKYEKEELKYTMDSAALAAWRKTLRVLKEEIGR
jgi:hypothetical protein